MSNLAIVLGPFNQESEIRFREIKEAADSIGGIDLRFVDSNQSFKSIMDQCRGAIVILPHGRYPELTKLAENLGSLKLIQTFSAGTDWLDKPQLSEMGIDVANNGGANAVAVAEHAIGLIFALYRKLDMQINSVKSGKWDSGIEGERTEFHTLVGKRIGIIGLGRIGSRVAKRLSGWECEIVYHDLIDFDQDYLGNSDTQFLSLDDLLSTSDVITLHVPLDRVTKHLISENEFTIMKKTSILINTCRGPVVDENALINALQSNQIFGAGLDVTETEPIDPNNPLLNMKNVIVTPHLATRAIESELNAASFTMMNTARVIRGKTADWLVKPV